MKIAPDGMKRGPVQKLLTKRFASVLLLGFPALLAILDGPRAAILMLFASQKTDGVITREADPHNHMYLSYEYSVHGRSYSGRGYAPHHADLEKGQAVEVFFFPPLPSQSLILGRDEQLRLAVWGLVTAFLLGALFAFIFSRPAASTGASQRRR